ncbi:SDR family NAD(P)-dependent oxidoreductase [Amycolatopsis rubida]|uniref:2-hydroxycyclohexanecarboxyl-CoA dehydrogenase n=1 Tax=Amycolatopsis rubida TaxID=112413 RepID=A0A1I5HPX6_9PSEU|nr:SDR family NAD(P)-dependent oxidoreductase [Amycolatopsis rubida]SFO50364.1 2-hydroxycyclohexanecarboxyl-CoA dehydrogenase [Amycolatopsis rubida]
MDTGLAGKVVIVTGATANIGRGIALAFAAEGAKVVVVGRDHDAGKRVTALALETGAAGAMWHAADVTERDAVAGMVSRTVSEFGVVDVLVNNVGGNSPMTPFAGSTPEQWRADLDVNLISTLLCTHQVLPHMLEREYGRIVNIGSMAALIGDPHLAVYSAAKGAVHSFTRVLALETGGSGITVNAIAPYGTLPQDPAAETSSGSRFHPGTGMFGPRLRAGSGVHEGFRRSTALTRDFARPAEIGAAAVYLSSEHAAFITGQVLPVEGGVSLT